MFLAAPETELGELVGTLRQHLPHRKRLQPAAEKIAGAPVFQDFSHAG